MHGYTIVKIDAAKPDIVSDFNNYMQASHPHTPAFIDSSSGYFRMEYDDKLPAASAPIVEFGQFLQKTGFTINGISTAKTADGFDGTQVCYISKEGKEECVLLSTLNVY
jgi:hypothetical protein